MLHRAARLYVALLVLTASVLWGSQARAALILDFRADDPNIVTSGSNVTTWPDQAQSLNATPVAGSNGPTLTTLNVNGQNKPALTFNGTNQYLKTGAITIPSTGSMFLVMNTSGPGSGVGHRTVGWDNASTGLGLCFIPDWDNNGVFLVARNSGGTGDVNAHAGKIGSNFEIVSITWGASGVTLDRTNYAGVTTHVGTNTAITSIAAPSGVTELRIGGSGSGGNLFIGALLELQAYNTQLSGAALTAVQTELMNTWFTSAPAPEPSCMGLTSLGFLGLACFRRRFAR